MLTSAPRQLVQGAGVEALGPLPTEIVEIVKASRLVHEAGGGQGARRNRDGYRMDGIDGPPPPH